MPNSTLPTTTTASPTPTPHDLFASIPWYPPTPTVPAWHKRGIPYLPTSNILQTLDVWLPISPFSAEAAEAAEPTQTPPTDLTTRPGYWLILVHGGGWRAPVVTSLNFAEPAVAQLLSLPTTPATPTITAPSPSHSNTSPSFPKPQIAGILSLSYTLSSNKFRSAPASSFPDPAEAASRSALHPQHILDVLSGLRFACEIFGDGVQSRGVVVGHSCGATLAVQCVMASGEAWMREADPQLLRNIKAVPMDLEGGGEAKEKRPFTPPALLLLCGLYDLPLLAEPTSPEFVQYREILRDMVAEAFGPEESDAGRAIWRRASPALALLEKGEVGGKGEGAGVNGFKATIPEAIQIICLATSETDGLVPPEQGVVMLETLQALGWLETDSEEGGRGAGGGEESCKQGQQGKRLMQLELEGQHDVIWEEGGEMARAVWAVLERLERLEVEKKS